LSLPFFITNCGKDDDNGEEDNPSSSFYTTATISHAGFDFSAGICDTVNWQNNDGETVSWQPNGGNDSTYPNNDKYIWFRNDAIDTVTYKNQTKNMGNVEISTITNVPTQWDTAPYINPLLTGHVIVAKCFDGYVKFEVLSADTSDFWPAQVKYYFSTTSTFDH
jgi:hypothetical protein